jgi:hypothetical protein
MNYPCDMGVEYNGDFEYRATLRNLFVMNSDKFPEITNPDIDTVTRDEVEYDDETTSQFMDFVYSNTKTDPVFIELYTKAASFMFSEDPEIGLAVLFSYDYLTLFHPCLSHFFKHHTLSRENPQYIGLYNKLFTK